MKTGIVYLVYCTLLTGWMVNANYSGYVLTAATMAAARHGLGGPSHK